MGILSLGPIVKFNSPGIISFNPKDAAETVTDLSGFLVVDQSMF
jgi:hypothetical protein